MSDVLWRLLVVAAGWLAWYRFGVTSRWEHRWVWLLVAISLAGAVLAVFAGDDEERERLKAQVTRRDEEIRWLRGWLRKATSQEGER